MPKIFFTLLVVFSLTWPVFAQKRQPPQPRAGGKVRTAAPPKIEPRATPEPAPKTVGLTFERYVSRHEVNADGTSTLTVEAQMRFDSEISAAELNNFERVFNADLEDIEVLEAYTIKAGAGAKTPVAADDIKKRPTPQAEAAPDFSSLKSVRIDFRDVKKGDAAFYRIRYATRRTIFERHFSEFELLPAVFDWKSIEINLSAPADYPIYAQAVGLEGGRLADEAGRARWQWRAQGVAALEAEEGGYDFISHSPRLALTSFKNYEQLGAAYWSEAKKRSVVTPEIRALAEQITKGVEDPRQQAGAIYEWVNKNIRYLSIVLERGGWIPHDATRILANGYGDCKDYVTIIHTLLKAKGIESHPVIIRADFTAWFPDAAVPDFFNHAILYIPSLEMFADATAPNTRLGLIPQVISGKNAFLAGEKTGLIKLPAGRPEDNQLLSEVEANFSRTGNVRAVSKNSYHGRAEMLFRPLFADGALRDGNQFVSLLLGYYGLSGTGKLLKVSDSHKVGEPFGVEMEVNLDNYTSFMTSGAVPIPFGLNMVNMQELERYARTERRRTDLPIGASRIRETYRLNFPAEVKIGSLPPAVKFENAVGSYRSEPRVEGASSALVTREIVVTKETITPAEYPLLRELIQKMTANHNILIPYTAAPNLARLKSVELRNNPPSPRRAPRNIEEYLKRAGAPPEKAGTLTRAAVARLEARLKADPADIETRKRLLRHYADYAVNDTPAREAARTAHRLWFVQNRPELGESEIFETGAAVFDAADKKEYQTLKPEWLKQVEARKTDARVRLNAVEFFEGVEWREAEKILLEGARLEPENYVYPLGLNRIYAHQSASRETAEAEKSKLREQAFEQGETALALMKRERSRERDAARLKLLPELAALALDSGRADRARALASELVLEFGDDVTTNGYDVATHVGNIIFGRVALKNGDAAKAKEHLLIAIRAPLRDENSFLTPDMKLARELFARGEKEAVAEYLRLCAELGNFKKYKELYEDEIAALKLWQEQIKQGKTPSFDFDNP